MATKSEMTQLMIERYRSAGQPWPATAKEIALWAINTRNWEAPPSALVNQCAEEIARAMRDEYVKDSQGRRVRTKHAATYTRGSEQFSFWDDIRTATPEHMQLAFQQRRQQVVGDCNQLKMDVDSYNENRKPERPVQVVFNFELDLAELDLARRKAARKAA